MKNYSVTRSLIVAQLFRTVAALGAVAMAGWFAGCGGGKAPAGAVASQYGVTQAAVTDDGLGPELPQLGAINAKATHPNGGGSKDRETIRDGVKPPVGASDTTLQFDTYDNTTPTDAKTDD